MRDYGPSPPVNTKVAGTFLNTSNIGRESSIHLCHKYPPDYNPLTLVPNESGVVHDGSNIRTYQVAFKVWTQPEIKTYGYWYILHFSRRNTGLLYCTVLRVFLKRYGRGGAALRLDMIISISQAGVTVHTTHPGR